MGLNWKEPEHKSIHYDIYFGSNGEMKMEKRKVFDKNYLGSKGWGENIRFFNRETGEEYKDLRFFHKTDAPWVWTGVDKPLYIFGWKVGTSTYELQGEDGFNNGGKQIAYGTVGLIISGGSLIYAEGFLGTALAASSMISSADDMTNKNGKTLLGDIIGNQEAVDISKGVISIANFSLGTQEIIKKSFEGDVPNFLWRFSNMVKDEFDSTLFLKEQTENYNNSEGSSENETSKKKN